MQDPLQPPALSEYEPEAKYELSTAAPATERERVMHTTAASWE